MKPPVCGLCGKRFDPFKRGGTVSFADYEPLPDGMVGHPNGVVWFCGTHLKRAKHLRGETTTEALKRLQRRYWLGTLMGHLRGR